MPAAHGRLWFRLPPAVRVALAGPALLEVPLAALVGIMSC